MSMRISAPFGIFFCLFLPSISLSADVPEDHVYQCIGPSETALYTDRDLPGCQAMALASLTIAPSRAYLFSDGTAAGSFLRPFPEDWFDNTAPVGSMRNRMANGGLYGTHGWIDYNAPVGSMRNSVTTWPSPYGW